MSQMAQCYLGVCLLLLLAFCAAMFALMIVGHQKDEAERARDRALVRVKNRQAEISQLVRELRKTRARLTRYENAGRAPITDVDEFLNDVLGGQQ